MIDHRNGLTRRGALTTAAGAAALPMAAGATLAGGTMPASASGGGNAPARPSHYRFDLGDFEITTVLDGFVQGEGPHPIFGENQEAGDVEALMEENFLPPRAFENQFTPMVVRAGGETILFDTGNPPARQPTAGNLVGHLRRAGLAPEDVSIVVITHCHGDHIGGLMSDGEPTYPHARYYVGQREFDFWTSDERTGTPAENAAQLVHANLAPLAGQTTFLDDGDEVVSGVTALAAHGHTPGHMVFHLESGGRRLLLWADTTNHFVASMQRPDWHVRFDMDKEAAAATRRRILDMVASERVAASGYHMPFPAVGFVERAGDGFRWIPASYQFNL